MHGHRFDALLNPLQEDCSLFKFWVDSLSGVLVRSIYAEHIMTFYRNIIPSTVLFSEVRHNLKEIPVFFL